jgi:hypothetical protein
MYNDTGYDFGGYDRVLELLGGGLTAVFDLKSNVYSEYSSHVHFTPVWFRDGQYQPTTFIIDCWTPNGMLSAQSSDTLNIQGSVFDDWHIKPNY